MAPEQPDFSVLDTPPPDISAVEAAEIVASIYRIEAVADSMRSEWDACFSAWSATNRRISLDIRGAPAAAAAGLAVLAIPDDEPLAEQSEIIGDLLPRPICVA